MVSARNAGIHRSTVYEWLEHDTDFSFAYNLAKEDAKDILRAEIYRRGVEGWDEKVFQLGLYAGTVRKYDTTLLIFHSKMLMPEYRDKSQVEPAARPRPGPATQEHRTSASMVAGFFAPPAPSGKPAAERVASTTVWRDPRELCLTGRRLSPRRLGTAPRTRFPPWGRIGYGQQAWTVAETPRRWGSLENAAVREEA